MSAEDTFVSDVPICVAHDGLTTAERFAVSTSFGDDKLCMLIVRSSNDSPMAGFDLVADDGDDTERDVNRRTVLQVLGTGVLAGVGLTGTASATWVIEKPVFCGCSQLCVCLEGDADVLMARETDDGELEVGFVVGDDELDPYPKGKPRYSGNFCVSTDDEDVPDGKIIGLQAGETRWVNPNQCAQKALDAERAQLDSTHERPVGDSGGRCGAPPCEHPSDKNGNDAADNGKRRARGRAARRSL